MCPLVEMSFGWGVESMSLPLCQPVWNPARGNFRRSLCFGWLSSSSSPVILWSCQAPWALPHSLSTLMGLMGEKTVSRLHQESPNYPIHLHRSPPSRRAIAATLTSRFPVRWQDVKKNTKKPHQDTIPRETSPAQTPPFMYCQWYFSNQDWGQHLWISRHAAVQGCQNVPIPYLDVAILGMTNISRVLLMHYRSLAHYRWQVNHPGSCLYCWNYLLKQWLKY